MCVHQIGDSDNQVVGSPQSGSVSLASTAFYVLEWHPEVGDVTLSLTVLSGDIVLYGAANRPASPDDADFVLSPSLSQPQVAIRSSCSVVAGYGHT